MKKCSINLLNSIQEMVHRSVPIACSIGMPRKNGKIMQTRVSFHIVKTAVLQCATNLKNVFKAFVKI